MNLSNLFFKKRESVAKQRELLEEQELMKEIIEEQQDLIRELEQANQILTDNLKQVACPEEITKHLCERIDMLKFKNMQETK
jgi:hypothetical protein